MLHYVNNLMRPSNTLVNPTKIKSNLLAILFRDDKIYKKFTLTNSSYEFSFNI